MLAFVAPLSGGEAVVALPMLEAVRRGAGAVEVVAFDDRREPERAADIVRALAADPAVIGVVGPKNSGTAAAAAPIAAAAGLPLLLPCATADGLCRPGGTVFRLCARDADLAEAAGDLCARLGVRTLAVLADDTAYGRGLAEAVKAAATRRRVMVTDGLPGADAVFHAMGEVEQADAMRATRSEGFPGPLFGAEGGPEAPLATLAGPAGEGSFQLYPGAAVAAPAVYTPEAEDAATALLHAAAADRPTTLARLRTLDLIGRSGPLSFDPAGERTAAAVTVWRLQGGRSVPEGCHPAA